MTTRVSIFHRSVRAITGCLGRHPALFGRAGGYALSLAIVAVSCVSVVHIKIQQIRAGHAQVLERMSAIETDVGALLTELNASYRPDCDADNLNRLRSLVFSHRYARNIGLLDERHRLFCSTSIGQLTVPVRLDSVALDSVVGRYYIGVPVQSFVPALSAQATAILVERGRFQVALDDSTVQDAFQRYADAVWVGAQPQRRRVFLAHAALAPAAPPEHAPLHIDWAAGRVLVTTAVHGVGEISVWSAIDGVTLMKEEHWPLAGMLALALALGFLASAGLTRRCRQFDSMQFRIRYLCDPANVVCHYQPIMELGSGRVVGCEVLARLRDGARLVYPDEFIPALTNGALTWAFDSAVSRHALQELGAALPAQTDFTVALNFFAQNLWRDVLHAHLQAAMRPLGRTDLRVELEVTEYEFSPEIVPELDRLKGDGYRISIDDFGTGYSNLGMVKRVAPDYLKIDRSFVFEMEDVTVRSTLIPEIIAIANAVGSAVIAEGIETAAQAAKLRALGVQYGQGYYFAKPLVLADLLLFLAARQTPAARAAYAGVIP